MNEVQCYDGDGVAPPVIVFSTKLEPIRQGGWGNDERHTFRLQMTVKDRAERDRTHGFFKEACLNNRRWRELSLMSDEVVTGPKGTIGISYREVVVHDVMKGAINNLTLVIEADPVFFMMERASAR